MEKFIMICSKEYLPEYFKQGSNRGYHIAFKSSHKPFKKANAIVINSLLEKHLEGKITLYFTPVYKSYANWCCIDVDVLEKGKVLEIDFLNNNYRNQISILGWILKKIGLSNVFDFINIIKKMYEEESSYIHSSNNFNIELRPSSPKDDKKCIQLPGYNFVAKRFGIPLLIKNDYSLSALTKLPSIKKLNIKNITDIIMEF